MRIADVLRDEDDDDYYYDHSFRSSLFPCWLFSCISRRRMVFSKLKQNHTPTPRRRRRKNSREVDRFGCISADDEELMKSNSEPLISSISNSNTQIPDSSSGKQIKDISFTLGLAVGLAFLTASSKSEINKMMELHSEVKTLVKEVRDEIQMKDAIFKTSESSDVPISSVTSYTKVGSTKGQSTLVNSVLSLPLEESRTNCGSCLKCNMRSKQEACLPGIDMIEAEVEAEIERLQLRLDTEEFTEHSQQHCPEAQIVKNPGCEEDPSAILGEIVDPDGDEQQNGVCPNELQRRLYELLEERHQNRIDELDSTTECSSLGEVDHPREAYGNDVSPYTPERWHSGMGSSVECSHFGEVSDLQEAEGEQQNRERERIKELESALEDIKHKLSEKELEVSWWKDLAEVMSQRVHLSR